MSTVEMTARPAAAMNPRARRPKNPTPRTAAGSTAASGATARRRGPARFVRNIGIALDTLVRVVLLGRDGMRY